MKKRSVSVLCLCTVLLGLASCGTAEEKPAVTTDGAETTGAAVTEEAGRPGHCVPTEELEVSGKTFRMLYGDGQSYAYTKVLSEEEAEVDAMSDAIWRRECAVEDALGVTIESEYFSGSVVNVANYIKRLVNAGDHVYDQVFLHCIYGVADLASENCLYDLGALPYIDMEAEWWNKTQMDNLRIGNKTNYAVNDFLIPCPNVIAFNKEMITNFDLDNPYELVYDGTWTVDRFISLAKEVAEEITGDGKYTIEDRYGLTVWESSKYASFLIGSGQSIAGRGEDGTILLTVNTPKTQTLIERFKDLMDQNAIWAKGGLNQTAETTLTMDSGRVLFYLDTIVGMEKLRDCEVEYGILPYPKFDEAQVNYISLDWGGLSCVPTTVEEPELVGAVMELLAWESANGVIPAYYERTLDGKLARDEDAVKMLDILFDTIAYDVGMNYFGFSPGVTDYLFCISKLAINAKSTDFASFYAEREAVAQKTVDALYERVLENED